MSDPPRPEPAAAPEPEQAGAAPEPEPAAPEPEQAGAAPGPATIGTAADAPGPDRRPRPLVERLGMAVIALVMAVLFALVGAAAFIGGEPFLGVMGICGSLMVLWVGTITAIRR